MMNLRIATKDLTLENCQHPGLLFDRFYPGCEREDKEGEFKRKHLQDVISSSNKSQVLELYKLSFKRWKEGLPKTKQRTGNLKTKNRMVLGLGKASVLEIGIHLHHHLGFPFIPGSSLKGICAHYCSKIWGALDESYKSTMTKDDKKSGEHHKFLFGDVTRAGAIGFEDAWWIPPVNSNSSPFQMDIITPHHKDWQDEGKAPPTDHDSPTPVSFLSFGGRFYFCLTWQGQHAQAPEEESEIDNWLDLAWKLLVEALCSDGVGGKKSSGYGSFDLEDYKKMVISESKEKLEAEKLRQKQLEFEKMTPLQQDIAKFIEEHPNKDVNTKDYMRLLEELRKTNSRWAKEEDRREVASMIKKAMIIEKKWEKKDKDGERTKYIKDILKES